jgi:hypothetical protein
VEPIYRVYAEYILLQTYSLSFDLLIPQHYLTPSTPLTTKEIEAIQLLDTPSLLQKPAPYSLLATPSIHVLLNFDPFWYSNRERESRRSSHYNLHSLFFLRKKYLGSTKYFLLYAHSLSVRIRKVTHIVTVYDHIRLYMIIYDRIRQSYSSVYGVENFTFESLRIFIRSPYTESVSHRFSSYTVPVYGNSVRPPYIFVFLRKRSLATVHIRPGYIQRDS